MLVIFSPAHANEPPPDPEKKSDEPIAVGWYFNKILGTTLHTNETTSYQRKSGWSQHFCSIGYKRTGENDTMIFIPIITLPSLENDHYEVKFSNGNLKVVRKSAKEELAVLHLGAIAPNTITQRPKASKKQPDHQEERDQDAKIDESPKVVLEFPSGHHINGTTFRMENRLTLCAESPDLVDHFCRIGYEQEGVFVPVISLPPIRNDYYDVDFSNGNLDIKTLRSKRQVVVFHLEALVPSAIIESRMNEGFESPKNEDEYLDMIREYRNLITEPDIEQPATHPESESEGADNPQPESEGRNR
mgnify:CR=1 FL=1